MNKEEIEEIEALEVSSKKAIYLIDDLIKHLLELQQENEQLKEELKYTVPIVEHNKIVSKKLKENQKYKEAIDKAIEFTNKNWGTWCTHHLEYMTELQDILKEVSE